VERVSPGWLLAVPLIYPCLTAAAVVLDRTVGGPLPVVLTAIAGSVIITWIYNHNERSVFGPILFHASLNFTRDSLHLSDRTELARTGFLVLLAAIVVLRCRTDTLSNCR
jgi:membrane protease YdiL (CAAX protease family)